MQGKIKVAILGGSGYAGGELLRLLLMHPRVEIKQVTSNQFAGRKISTAHPNLRKVTELQFCKAEELQPCDLLFVATPHGFSMSKMPELMKLAPKIIDLSSDFRLKNADDYKIWYGHIHPNPHLLKDAVYGMPELHRDEIRNARIVAGPGCLATATILALHPLLKNGLIEGPISVDGKIGSSAAGNKSSDSSHHPDRMCTVRPYKATGHRHTAEMEQELGTKGIYFSPHAIEMVRGISISAQMKLKDGLKEIDVWKAYRKEYGNEPFIRIVKEKEGVYRFPEPKILTGSNYCDIGFELEGRNNRLFVISAIDNMMKGAGGQAVHCMNIMFDFGETLGLENPGFHPI